MGGNLVNELQLLRRRCSIDTPLNNTAAMTMRSNFNTAHGNRVVNELVVVRFEELETFLHDMVPIEVLSSNQ